MYEGEERKEHSETELVADQIDKLEILPATLPMEVCNAESSTKMLKSPQILQHEHRQLEILRTIGTGSFAHVFLVRNVVDKQAFALKVIRKSAVQDRKHRKHVFNERDVLRGIEHPFIIKLHDAFVDNSNLYLLMDFVRGGELFRYMKTELHFDPQSHEWVGFDENRARFYISQVVLALEELHSYNIIYRDLKPENLLVGLDGYLKLADFGFACQLYPSSVRLCYTICGTPEYMAPEIHFGRGYDKGVDYWAMGVLLFEMVGGISPFYHEDRMQIIKNIDAGSPTYPHFFSVQLMHLVRNLLQVDRTRRYGAMHNGIRDIKNDPWFSPTVPERLWFSAHDPARWFNFERIREKSIPAPFKPMLYPEEGLQHCEGGSMPPERYLERYFDPYPEEEILIQPFNECPGVFDDFGN